MTNIGSKENTMICIVWRTSSADSHALICYINSNFPRRATLNGKLSRVKVFILNFEQMGNFFRTRFLFFTSVPIIRRIMIITILPKPDGCAKDCKTIISAVSKPLNPLVEWHTKTQYHFQILLNSIPVWVID